MLIPELLIKSLPIIKQGTLTTLSLWFVASVLSMTFGVAAGIIRSHQVRIPLVSLIIDGITFLLRGIPFYVQLLIAYFVLPGLTGISLSAFAAGALSLGLCSAAYVSQMVRGTINSIPQGQWEAARTLGYNKAQTLRHIIMPQVMIMLIPQLGSEFDQLLKSTAIISSIGVLELTLTGKNLVAKYLEPLTIYSSIAVVYLLISSIILGISTLLERKLSYGRH